MCDRFPRKFDVQTSYKPSNCVLGLIFVVNIKFPRVTYHTIVPSTEQLYCLNGRLLLCRTTSRIPAFSDCKSFPFVNFLTYLLLSILILRYLEWFLFSLACSRYRESFVLRGIVVLKWFARWIFGSLHSRVTFSNAGVFTRSLDACSVFDRPSMSRKTHCSYSKGPITWGGLARLAGISARLWNILLKNQLCDYMEKSQPG